MSFTSVVVVAIVLVSSAGFAITRTSGSAHVTGPTARIDVDKLHAKVDLNAVRLAGVHDAF